MLSAPEIGAEAGVSSRKCTILRVSVAKRVPASRLTNTHKQKSIDFCRNNMSRDWEKGAFKCVFCF